MMKLGTILVGGVTLLLATAANGQATAQQQCDYNRITAWKVYQGCIEGVVAKDAKGVGCNERNEHCFDSFTGFARCRHSYLGKWKGFQQEASLAGSTCVGARFTDNTDGTVTDNLSGLVWEKKTSDGSVHDVGNGYTLTTGPPYIESGTAYTSFLATLNSSGFAGASGWRLPTLPELQTIVLDFPCKGAANGPNPNACICAADPCIDPAFGLALSGDYWSATSELQTNPDFAWFVFFGRGWVYEVDFKDDALSARAVRGGL